MINLTYTGMCKDCKHADLELNCLEYTGFDGVTKDWTVRCVHARACESMEEKVTEKYAGYVEYVCGTRKDGDAK